MKKSILQLFTGVQIVIITTFLLSWSPIKPERAFYQLIIYHFKTDTQQTAIDNYLQHAILPALHRTGIKNIGVFKSHGNDTLPDKTMFVFIPLKSLDIISTIPSKLNADKEYQLAGVNYINAAYTSPPYTRMETILLQAFPLAPVMQLPVLKGARNERVYELRSYEGPTEKIFQNKIQMFNEGDEIGLFKRLNFNAVFYSEVIAGSKMPNLMYMTCFENMADREAHWKSFGSDAYWKKLSSMPEYQHNVSRNEITFLYPTTYSDF